MSSLITTAMGAYLVKMMRSASLFNSKRCAPPSPFRLASLLLAMFPASSGNWLVAKSKCRHVAATDKGHARKRRILENVLPGENTHVTDRFANSIAALHFGEKTSQPFCRDIGRNTFRVDRCAGFVNGCLAEVRAKKL